VFLKLLNTLEYPFIENFALSSQYEIVRLVSWLEDRKIRALEISERDSLRVSNDKWSASFQNYLNQLSCPFEWKDINNSSDIDFDTNSNFDTLFWLVSYSVNIEYEDVADELVDIENCTSSSSLMDIDAAATTPSIHDNNIQNESIETRMISDDETTTTANNTEIINNNDNNATAAELSRKHIDSLGKVIGISRHSAGENDSDYFQRLGHHIHLYYSSTAKAAYEQYYLTNNIDNNNGTAAYDHNAAVGWERFPLGFEIDGK
jgi:hypothetical protein